VRAADERASGDEYSFVILRRRDNVLIGICGVRPAEGFEMGYWIGKPYWGQGYATEAARLVLAFAFGGLNAAQVIAGWMADNPASGRVLEKLGFRPLKTEERVSISRGHAVYCHLMGIDRQGFEEK
jgi:RimJ/RimL family protein N-acetyltransferase